MYKCEIRADPANGLQTAYRLPDDVILNTRRAFSVSATSPNGYCDLGAPEGRYFAPANSADCIQLKAGDCATATLLVRAPFFTRFDIGLTKRFPIGGRTNIELRFDVLNVFDNINFNPVANPGRRRDHLPDRQRPTAIRTTTSIRAAGWGRSRSG